MSNSSPRFPSLYDPKREAQADYALTHGLTLQHSRDVYRFTLYWSLILLIPLFVVPGFWALGMIARALWHRERRGKTGAGTLSGHFVRKIQATVERTKLLMLAAAVVPLAFAVVGAFLAVVLSVCIAYLLVGIYVVTGFHMSTWIPFIWSLMQTLFVVLGSYTLVIDVI
ncbi:hypothetical protein EXIGLDRAFT_831990 [Exidia glandulosa HHB12029]|uniref:Uncharacterized protein n=1 Tax=Exidia glandulosa HHB12029 TaxID=1314781 RepID=A0A165M508_EXIGL|nr:hypothetical protein EXIGLDRAFT_831990 [Exidia glandulosa HHB12029]